MIHETDRISYYHRRNQFEKGVATDEHFVVRHNLDSAGHCWCDLYSAKRRVFGAGIDFPNSNDLDAFGGVICDLGWLTKGTAISECAA